MRAKRARITGSSSQNIRVCTDWNPEQGTVLLGTIENPSEMFQEVELEGNGQQAWIGSSSQLRGRFECLMGGDFILEVVLNLNTRRGKTHNK